MSGAALSPAHPTTPDSYSPVAHENQLEPGSAAQISAAFGSNVACPDLRSLVFLCWCSVGYGIGDLGLAVSCPVRSELRGLGQSRISRREGCCRLLFPSGVHVYKTHRCSLFVAGPSLAKGRKVVVAFWGVCLGASQRTRLWLPLQMCLVVLLQRHRKALQRKGLAHSLTKKFLRNCSPVKRLKMAMVRLEMTMVALMAAQAPLSKQGCMSSDAHVDFASTSCGQLLCVLRLQ
nr:uncharacterized protein LOC117853649 [Setaria viridis]